jgi:hypothetical protein
VDWSREAFTMDSARQEAVIEAFVRLYRFPFPSPRKLALPVVSSDLCMTAKDMKRD